MRFRRRMPNWNRDLEIYIEVNMSQPFEFK